MKKILILAIISLLLLSTFTIIVPQVYATFAGSSEKGILTVDWKYDMQSLYGTIYFGSSPAIANLMEGPDLEIVTGSDEYYNYYPELGAWANGIWRCFDSKGNLIWAKDTGTDESRSSPVIADINQDGYLDIVGGTTSGWNVEAMDRFGNFIWTFPWPPVPGAPFLWPSSPAAADIDVTISGLEIVIGNWWLGSVWAFDGDNSDGLDDGITVTDWWIYGGIEGVHWDVLWIFQTAGSVVSSPALGDIDNDGQIEIIIGSMDGKVYVLDGITGAMEYSYQTDGGVASSAAIANLDGDPYLEVVIGSSDGKIYCLQWSGIAGVIEWTFSTFGGVYSSPSVGDIDGDGKYDIVVGSDDGNIYALNADGSLKWSYQTGGAIHSSPALANRGTGGLGIYIGSYDDYLYLIDGISGNLIDRFLTYGDVYTSPSVADVDGDGKLEIFFYDASWSLYRYTFWALEDTGSTVSPYTIEWQMFRRDASRTGLYPIVMPDPWTDDDGDGIPNYLDRPEFNVTYYRESFEVFNRTWHIGVYYISPACGVKKMLDALHELGVEDTGYFMNVTAVIIDYKLECGSLEEFVEWQASYGFINASYAEEVKDVLEDLHCRDGHFREAILLKYNSTEDHDVESYLITEGSLRARFKAIAQTITRAGKEVFKGIEKQFKQVKLSITLNMVHLFKQLFKGELTWAKLTQTLVGKGLAKAIGTLVNLAVKKLTAGASTAIKVAIALGFAAHQVYEIIKDPYPDIHVFDKTQHHVLGIDYETGIEKTTFQHGVYFGRADFAQFAMLSKQGAPYDIAITLKNASSYPYFLIITDTSTDETTIFKGEIHEDTIITTRIEVVDGKTVITPPASAVQLTTWTTDSDFNNITNFRAVFTPYRNCYKLRSTNPGQFYFNILVNNTSPLPINMTIKYALDPSFTLKGARPIHVYADLNRTIDITSNCIFLDNTIMVYNVAPSSIIYITIHLEYALKGAMLTKDQVNTWFPEELFEATVNYTLNVIFGSESSETRLYGYPKIVK